MDMDYVLCLLCPMWGSCGYEGFPCGVLIITINGCLNFCLICDLTKKQAKKKQENKQLKKQLKKTTKKKTDAGLFSRSVLTWGAYVQRSWLPGCRKVTLLFGTVLLWCSFLVRSKLPMHKGDDSRFCSKMHFWLPHVHRLSRWQPCGKPWRRAADVRDSHNRRSMS